MEPNEGREKSLKIEQQLKFEKIQFQNTNNLLTFGNEASGLNEFLQVVAKKYNTERDFLQKFHSNTVLAITHLIDSAKKFGLSLDDKVTPHAQTLKSLTEPVEITAALVSSIEVVWSSKTIKETLTKLKNSKTDTPTPLPLIEIEYLLDNCTEFIKNNTNPYLKANPSPNGSIKETRILFNSSMFNMIDFRNQKGLQRKWISCFYDTLSGILFFSSLQDYDLPSESDPSITKLAESLQIWERLGQQFAGLPFLLFLTDGNQFQAKLKQSPLAVHFPEWKSTEVEGSALTEERFILHLFTSRLPKGTKVFPWTVDRSDFGNGMKKIYTAVRDWHISSALSSTGF